MKGTESICYPSSVLRGVNTNNGNTLCSGNIWVRGYSYRQGHGRHNNGEKDTQNRESIKTVGCSGSKPRVCERSVYNLDKSTERARNLTRAVYTRSIRAIHKTITVAHTDRFTQSLHFQLRSGIEVSLKLRISLENCTSHHCIWNDLKHPPEQRIGQLGRSHIAHILSLNYM